MKKIISIAVCLSMLLSIAVPVYAAETIPCEKDYTVLDVSEGKLYASKDEEKSVAILTDEEQLLIDISINYLDNPDIVYQWIFNDYPITEFVDNVAFWNGIIEYAEEHRESASIIEFEDITYENPIDVSMMRSSAGADLIEDMENLLGKTEYDKQIKKTTYKSEVFRIRESLVFRVVTSGSKSWSKKITVATLITGVLGLPGVTDDLLSAICGAFGVTVSAATLLPAGKINKYSCRAITSRYVTVNGSSYAYNITDKIIEYKGYEDADNSSKERAYVDSSSKTTSYTDSKTYFNSYDSQIKDAYDTFLRIGQMN